MYDKTKPLILEYHNHIKQMDVENGDKQLRLKIYIDISRW